MKESSVAVHKTSESAVVVDPTPTMPPSFPAVPKTMVSAAEGHEMNHTEAGPAPDATGDISLASVGAEMSQGQDASSNYSMADSCSTDDWKPESRPPTEIACPRTTDKSSSLSTGTGANSEASMDFILDIVRKRASSAAKPPAIDTNTNMDSKSPAIDTSIVKDATGTHNSAVVSRAGAHHVSSNGVSQASSSAKEALVNRYQSYPTQSSKKEGKPNNQAGIVAVGITAAHENLNIPEPSAPGAYAQSPSTPTAPLSVDEATEESALEAAVTEPLEAVETGNAQCSTTIEGASSFGSSADVLLEATLVDGYGSYNSIRPLVQAVPLEQWCTLDCRAIAKNCSSKRATILSSLLLLTIVLALGIGLGLGLSGNGNSKSTLQTIQYRGILKCGVGSYSPALHFFDENGERTGFDVALCRAVAAAILGDGSLVDFKILNFKGRFLSLASGEVDMVAAGATHTMEREVYESESHTAFSFSTPYLYEGLHFAGDPRYVACVEGGIHITGDCSELKVCTIEGTSHHAMISRLVPGRQLVAVPDYSGMIGAFVDGTCNVIAHEGHQLQEISIRDLGYVGDYAIGSDVYSKEPLALVTRSNDAQWSKLVDMTLHGLLLAEKHEITKENANAFPQTQLLGIDYTDMFQKAIAVGGNYGELYNQFLEPIIPRRHINTINALSGNASDSGLLFSHPLGYYETYNNADVGGYMGQIQNVGELRCGVIIARPGFADFASDGLTYEGIEVDLCRALSAAMFDGSTMELVIILVEDEEEGYSLLAEGAIDVFSGASWDYQSYNNEALDKATRYSFSPPYFYNNTASSSMEENLCLITAADDHSWSTFVHWVVTGLIIAEEESITTEDFNSMPEINLFGPGYKRMIRDAVLTIGNMAEVYERNLEAIYTRQGRNLLNSGVNPGPQHYPIPGLVVDARD